MRDLVAPFRNPIVETSAFGQLTAVGCVAGVWRGCEVLLRSTFCIYLAGGAHGARCQMVLQKGESRLPPRVSDRGGGVLRNRGSRSLIGGKHLAVPSDASGRNVCFGFSVHRLGSLTPRRMNVARSCGKHLQEATWRR